MLWTHALIGTVRQIETAKPKEGPAPQPQKMWINSVQKAAVSPATNRVTSLGIAQINLQTTKPINPRKRKLKPAKLPLQKTKKLLMRKTLITEALISTLGSIKVKPSKQKARKKSFVRLGKLKLECWLVQRRIFKDGNPVGLGTPSQIGIEDCIC